MNYKPRPWPRDPLKMRGWALFPRVLRYVGQVGMQRGRDVARWQQFLQVVGFFNLRVDGYFGAHTEQCSIKYMKRHGLDHKKVGVPRFFRYRLYALGFIHAVMLALGKKKREQIYPPVALTEKENPHGTDTLPS